MMDAKGTIHTMHKLLYADIRNEGIRKEILAHFKRQAARQAAHVLMGSRIGKSRRTRPWLKILSDADDTFLSSGGRYPAGCDSTYPRKEVYPGVISFYREVDLGPDPWVDKYEGIWPEGQVGNLALLSARPHLYKDVLEKRVYSSFP